MKTDLASLGEAALERLRRTAAQAQQVQRQQLECILRQNSETEYGRRYGFSGISCLNDYQAQVPLSRYGDYHPYVERLLAGDTNLLTCSEPVYYAITSGSTGVPKYVPVTEEDMLLHYRDIYGGVFGMVRKHFPGADPEALFGKIFQVGEFAKTCLPGGQMCGIRSASLYQWLDREGGFDASAYCVPKEVLFPAKVEDLTYVKARFALMERGITAIHGVFLHRVVGMLDYIREHWSLLLRDMEHGTVDESIPLGEPWRQRLLHWLPPEPVRAAQLRHLRVDVEPEEMVLRLWPGIQYIVGIGGRAFPVYARAIEQYAGSVPIHHFIYGASEGFLSIAAGVGRPDAYILLPEAGVFEFLPVSRPEGKSLSIGEVEKGGRYELVFTNHSGLYRYRMQDVLEVVDFFGQSPVIRFCYRINQALNVADEKLNTEQLGAALALFQQRAGLVEASFCAQADFSVRPGRYLIYAQIPPVKDAAGLVDQCLKEVSLGYQGCRASGDVAAPLVRFLPKGSFRRYEECLARGGKTLDQYKPVLILDSEEKRRFFAKEAERGAAL